MRKVTIIPDVHGRPFWRDAVKDVADTPVIFLGDYLDPYPQDIVSWDEAWNELLDIIQLKREYPEQVTLLLGNHDVHYFDSFPFFSRGGRRSKEHYDEVQKFYMDNLDLFDIAKVIDSVSGLPYLMTHAGVQDRWIEANVRYIERNHPDLYWYARKCERECRTPQGFATFINESLHSTDEKIFDFLIWSLGDVSGARGGRGVGSCVWVDISDINGPCSYPPLQDCRQIVGHTRQDALFEYRDAQERNLPVISIDFGRAFLLDTDSGELNAKMELKESFCHSDISCLPKFNIFDLDVWNLAPEARAQAEKMLNQYADEGSLIRYGDNAYIYPPYIDDGEGHPREWQKEEYEEYRNGKIRFI